MKKIAIIGCGRIAIASHFPALTSFENVRIKYACDILNDDKILGIFPEGTRSKDGEIHNFKMGAFSLAKEAGVEILPVVMTGTNQAFKKGWLVNWRHRVAIRVLKPVSVEEVEATGTKELSLQIRERMVTALAELREEVKAAKK